MAVGVFIIYVPIFSCVEYCRRSLLGSSVELVQFSVLIMKKREGKPASEWIKSPSVFSPTKAELYLPKDFGTVKMKHDLFNRLKSKVSILVLFLCLAIFDYIKEWVKWSSTVCDSKAVCGLFLCQSGRKFARLARQGTDQAVCALCCSHMPLV